MGLPPIERRFQSVPAAPRLERRRLVAHPVQHGRDEKRSGRQSQGILSSGKGYIDAYRHQLDELVKLFGGSRARDLELRTTIVYLWRNSESIAGGNRDELLSVLQELKPQFNEWEIDAAVEELLGAGII